MPDDPIQPVPEPEIKQEEEKPTEEIKTEESVIDTPPAETPVETPPQTEEVPKVEEPKIEDTKLEEKQKPEESQSHQSPQEPEVKVIEKEIIKEIPVEVIKEVVKEVKVEDPELSRRIADEMVRERLLENKKKADEARAQRRKDKLNRIVGLAKKKEINNLDVRDLLQVSQSTATDYLTELSKSGRLKLEKKARATVYKS